MKLQNYELKDIEIKNKYIKLKKKNPELFKKRLKFSWSNWGFGVESLEDTAKRLSNHAGTRLPAVP